MKFISADYIKTMMKNDRLMQGNAEHTLWCQEVERLVDAMPSIEVSKDCKTCIWNTCNYNKVPWEVSEDAVSKAYIEQKIENQIMIADKDDEYWIAWNNALNKVVELIEDAPCVILKRK